jgi:hypothetical protein
MFYGGRHDAEFIATIQRAIDLGDLLHTADMYGRGDKGAENRSAPNCAERCGGRAPACRLPAERGPRPPLRPGHPILLNR